MSSGRLLVVYLIDRREGVVVLRRERSLGLISRIGGRMGQEVKRARAPRNAASCSKRYSLAARAHTSYATTGPIFRIADSTRRIFRIAVESHGRENGSPAFGYAIRTLHPFCLACCALGQGPVALAQGRRSANESRAREGGGWVSGLLLP